jgi:protein-S-isoprenylcysteine O-methyltransferase Ste14
MTLFLKNLLFTLVVPGTMVVWLPHVVREWYGIGWSGAWNLPQLAAVPIGFVGLAMYLRCIWDFAHRGRATPAPIDPPRVLVVEGLYRYVRNPMYLGVLLVILAQVIWFQSPVLALYCAAFWLFVHTFVLLHEEPALRRRFDHSYVAYCGAVHRWLPGWHSPRRPARSPR